MTTVEVLPATVTSKVPSTTVEVLPTIVTNKVPSPTVEVLPTTSKVPLTTVEVLPTTSKVPSTIVEVTELPITVKDLPETDEVPSTTANVELPSNSLARLGDVLGEDKISFLDDLQASINTYIVGTGRQCIAVVQKIPNPDVTDDNPASQYVLHKYELNMDDLGDFVKVLFKFMTKKRHQGYELDSALTAPALDIVQQKFVGLYESHGQEISHELLQSLRTDDILLESFVSSLSDIVSTKLSKAARGKIVHLVTHQMHNALASHAAHVVGHHAAHFATTVVGHQVALVAVKVLLHALTKHIGHVIFKFTASAAFKKLLFAVGHKMIMAAIVTAVVQHLNMTFRGSSRAGAASFVKYPIIAAMIFKHVKGFPKNLGREVSKSVRDHLDLEFSGMNRDILRDTFKKVFQGRELLEAVAKEAEIHEMFHTLAKEID